MNLTNPFHFYRIYFYPFGICWIIWNSFKFLVSIRNSNFYPNPEIYSFAKIRLRTSEHTILNLSVVCNFCKQLLRLYWIFALTFGPKTAPLHIITDKTSMLWSSICLKALIWVNDADVFFKHLFQLEACFDKGINWIDTVVMETNISPKKILGVASIIFIIKMTK